MTPSENNTNRAPAGLRPWIGLGLGPLLAVAVYLTIPAADAGGLAPPGRMTAAVGVLMATWWVTEALPLPATALLPLALFPLLGVAPMEEVAAPYASEIIFLFMGGFLLGLGMERWGLHKRIALRIILAVGTGPRRLVAGFMVASAGLSMWISNTAAVIILLPVAVSVIRMLTDPPATAGSGAPTETVHEDPRIRTFATCLMLAIAYAASIGGVGTLIGSPPNLVAAGFLENRMDCSIGMLDWMKFGIPLVGLFLPLTWAFLTFLAFPLRGWSARDARASDAPVRRALEDLGAMSRGEKVISVVFAATALAWMLRPTLEGLPGLGLLTDPAIAMVGALALFLIPVERGERAMDWDTASRLPWGVLLLFGGGLSLAAMIAAHDVDAFIAGGLEGFGAIPVWALLVLVVVLVKLATEMTSNTAVATTFIPVLAAMGMGMGAPPEVLAVAVALSASYAFIMPVATPPNAIVFGSGYIRIGEMVRAGLVLNLLSIGPVAATAWLGAPGLCS